MDKNELRSLWHDAHVSNQDTIYDNISIEKSITLNHSKAIFKVISDVKMKILISGVIFVIYIGLIFYAFIYLSLSLSFYSLVPLSLAGLFLIFITTSEIGRLLVLTKTADNMSVKESLLFFRKKLERIRTIDFLSYMIFLYLSAILIILNYLNDIGGVKNLSWNNEILPVPLLVVLILILLLLPWFIKYQHNQRYKKIYSNLNDSARFFNIEA
jgi:hypothetical protein